MLTLMLSCLDVLRVNFQLGIWVSRFIFGGLQMVNGKLWRKGCNYD
jgi:hypothetical protein